MLFGRLGDGVTRITELGDRLRVRQAGALGGALGTDSAMVAADMRGPYFSPAPYGSCMAGAPYTGGGNVVYGHTYPQRYPRVHGTSSRATFTARNSASGPNKVRAVSAAFTESSDSSTATSTRVMSRRYPLGARINRKR